MANVRVTKKERFEAILGILEGVEGTQELVEFVNKEIERIANRKVSMTATQKENAVLVEDLYDVIAGMAEPATITEIMKADEKFGAMSNQKVSALAKKLVDAGRVVKTTDKKKSYFSVEAE